MIAGLPCMYACLEYWSRAPVKLVAGRDADERFAVLGSGFVAESTQREHARSAVGARTARPADAVLVGCTRGEDFPHARVADRFAVTDDHRVTPAVARARRAGRAA